MIEPEVVLIGPYPSLGAQNSVVSGVAPYTRQLARSLTDHGLAVHVVAPREKDTERLGRDGAVVVDRAFRRGPAALPSALRAARAAAAPIVHLQHELFLYGGVGSLPALLPSLFVSRRSGACIVTMHQVVAPDSVDRSFTRMHRVRAPASSARACLDSIQKSMPRVSDRVIVHETAFTSHVPGSVVVPHGIETLHVPDKIAARKAAGLDDRFTVLCFGFVAPYKGLETALSAGRDAGIRVIVAGGTHPRLPDGSAYLDGLMARFPDAVFTGHVPDEDVTNWFAAADTGMFLYPKPHATSGGLHLALAHGTPFLLSGPLAHCTGAPALTAVSSGVSEVARRLQILAEDANALHRLEQTCKDMARGRTWPVVAQKHAAIYREVIHARSTGRG